MELSTSMTLFCWLPAPIRSPIHPGAAVSHVHYLRSFDDSKTIADKTSSAKRVLVIGASFIGLEVAASLRGRNIEVHLVAPEQQPLGRVLGFEAGAFIECGISNE